MKKLHPLKPNGRSAKSNRRKFRLVKLKVCVYLTSLLFNDFVALNQGILESI